MDEKTTPAENDQLPEEELAPEATEAAKKKRRLNALTLGVVFALTMVLPARYKPFALALFLLPVIYDIVEKMRRPADQAGMSAHDPGYYDPVSGHTHGHDPYEIEPKDPQKDPRRYKPIG